MLSIGVDIGVKGGLAAISECYTASVIMPIFPGVKGGSKSKINIRETMAWIKRAIETYQAQSKASDKDKVFVTMESVHAMPGQGVSSMFSFGETYGLLQAMTICCGCTLQLVTPQAWKAPILAGTPKDKTAAIQHVDRVYPTLNIYTGPRKVSYHDGVADAVCLAEYGAAIAR